jgi:cytidine deaminase
VIRYIRGMIGRFEIAPTDEKKKKEYRSLSDLVTMLFAIIFGVGLNELGEVKGGYDFSVLLLAYLAVMLSWWGYNWGIVLRPETNVLNYLIDSLLIVVYWFLINSRAAFGWVAVGYVAMFALYWLWEVVRAHSKAPLTSTTKTVQSAGKVNFLFLLFACMVLIFHQLWCKASAQNLVCMAWLYILVIGHRVWVHRVYHKELRKAEPPWPAAPDLEKKLVERARDIAGNARVHLSGFRVGAAILSESGRIHVGCNIEFDNYSNTIHAEEAAISAFVAAGEERAVSIAVYTAGAEVCFPCGMCRQSLFELGGSDLTVIACNDSTFQTKTMDELLPSGFHL